MIMTRLGAVAAAALLLAAPALAQQPAPAPAASGVTAPVATVELMNTKGQRIGTVALTQFPRGVLVSGQVQNVAPGWHGIHLHETGACTPDFAAAGAHHNPDHARHGLGSVPAHAGDLPNLFVHADGSGQYQAWTDDVSLADGPASLFDADGTALVLHAAPDDYTTDPSGNSGDRIACGVVTKR